MHFIASIVAIAWFLAAEGSASKPVAESAGAKTIVVGTAVFPPFCMMENGQMGGVDTAIVRAVFKKIGYEVDLQVFPWPRTYKLGVEGKLPVIFSFTRSEEREKHFYFSKPVNTVKDVLFKKKSRTITWQKLKHLQGLTIGVSQGYSYAPEFMELVKSGEIKTEYAVGDNPELVHLRKLAKDRIDAFICEASVCSHLIQLHPEEFKDIHFINRVVGTPRPFHVGFAKSVPGSKQLQRAFDKALEQAALSGELLALYRRYGIVSVAVP